MQTTITYEVVRASLVDVWMVVLAHPDGVWDEDVVDVWMVVLAHPDGVWDEDVVDVWMVVLEHPDGLWDEDVVDVVDDELAELRVLGVQLEKSI